MNNNLSLRVTGAQVVHKKMCHGGSSCSVVIFSLSDFNKSNTGCLDNLYYQAGYQRAQLTRVFQTSYECVHMEKVQL